MQRLSRFDLSAWLWLIAGIVVFWSFGYAEMRGGDLWWHVAAGRLIVENGSPWLLDLWSYTHTGSAWLNHEWLADIIFYGWASAFGLDTLAYWKWLVVVTTYALLQQVLFRLCGDRLTALAGAVFAVAVAAPFLDVRPHLYSLLNYCVLLALLLGRAPSRWAVAVLFVVWVNLHGGFFFGLLALAILLVPWQQLSGARLRVGAVTLLIGVAACAINPFGFDVYFYVLKYAFEQSSPYRELGEWLPPFHKGGIQAPLFIWAIGVFALAATSYLLPLVRRRCGIPWAGLILAGLTLAMSLTSRRFIPLFAISLTLVATPIVATALSRLPSRLINHLVPAAALATGLYLLLPYPQSSAHAFHYLTGEYTFPVDTLDFIETNGLGGKVFAYYLWGGYMHLRTGGRMQVYIDGRADTVFDDRTFIDYLRVSRHQRGWLDVIESSGAEYFLWPLERGYGAEKLRVMLASRRWHPLYRDSVGYLLVQTGVALPATITAPAASAYRAMGIGSVNLSRGNLAQAERNFLEAAAQMSYLKSACHWVARTQARLGKADAARARVDICARLYPGAVGLAQTRALLEELRQE